LRALAPVCVQKAALSKVPGTSKHINSLTPTKQGTTYPIAPVRPQYASIKEVTHWNAVRAATPSRSPLKTAVAILRFSHARRSARALARPGNHQVSIEGLLHRLLSQVLRNLLQTVGKKDLKCPDRQSRLSRHSICFFSDHGTQAPLAPSGHCRLVESHPPSCLIESDAVPVACAPALC